MSQSLDFAAFEPVCGCQGCHEPVVWIIHHPDHGRRAVCDGHQRDHTVIEHV